MDTPALHAQEAFVTKYFLIILMGGLLILYNINMKHLAPADSIPTRLLPLSFLLEGNADLDEFHRLYASGTPSYLLLTRGHYVSIYPIGGAILATPFYLIPYLFIKPAGWTPSQSMGNELFVILSEKLAASVLASGSALFLYLALRRVAPIGIAMSITVIYGLGTSTFSTSSQALWQHGPAQFCLAMGLYLLVRGREEQRYLGYSGLPLAGSIWCRYTDLLLIIPLAIYVLRSSRKEFGRFLMAAMPPMMGMALYQFYYFGLSAVKGAGFVQRSPQFWQPNFLQGLANILFSPGRGLFVYSPIFVFSVFGMFLAWKSSSRLFRAVSLSALLGLFPYCFWRVWWGGWSFGPRLLADLTPFLSLLLYPAYEHVRGRPLLRCSFWALAGCSIAFHALGTLVYARGWNAHPNIDIHPERLWLWLDNDIVYQLKHLFRTLSTRGG